MVMVAVCDECGKMASGHLELATGRVMIDGEDCGQGVDLCRAHYPEDHVGMCQPRDCVRVRFVWPGRMASWVR